MDAALSQAAQLVSVKRAFQVRVDELVEPVSDPATGRKRYANRLIIVVDDLDRIRP